MRYGLFDDVAERRGSVARMLAGAGYQDLLDGRIVDMPKGVASCDVIVLVADPSVLAAILSGRPKSGRVARIPLVLVTTRGRLDELLPLVQEAVYGVVTFDQGVPGLLASLREIEHDLTRGGVRMTSADRARRCLGFLSRGGASGVLVLRSAAGSGQILLHAGECVDAEVGAVRGEQAAALLLASIEGAVEVSWNELDSGVVGNKSDRSETAQLTTLGGAPLPDLTDDLLRTAEQVQVLCVDDDEAILTMLERMLGHRGFCVTTAADGEEGATAALHSRPHVVLSDIMMPRLDGWGLLSRIRSDYRLRETPFMLLSCHHGYLDSLQKISAGADAYLAKGMRLEEIAQHLWSLARPRLELMAHLGSQPTLRGYLTRIGPRTLLLAMVQVGVAGKLTIADDWARYDVFVEGGQLVSAQAKVGSTVLDGVDAVRSLIGVVHGRWFFEAGAASPQTALGPVAAVLEELGLRATEEEGMLRDRLVGGETLVVKQPDTIEMYESICPQEIRPLVAAIRRGAGPRELLAAEGADPLVVDWLFKDLLVKGVVGVSGRSG